MTVHLILLALWSEHKGWWDDCPSVNIRRFSRRPTEPTDLSAGGEGWGWRRRLHAAGCRRYAAVRPTPPSVLILWSASGGSWHAGPRSGSCESRRRAIDSHGQSSLQRDDAVLEGEADQVRLVFQAELVHEVGSMGFDRPAADGEPFGNLTAAVTLGDQLQDLPFS